MLHGPINANIEVLCHYCDGIAFNEHLLYSRDHIALQIILYYDEL